jgi:hypothetical protein
MINLDYYSKLNWFDFETVAEWLGTTEDEILDRK